MNSDKLSACKGSGKDYSPELGRNDKKRWIKQNISANIKSPRTDVWQDEFNNNGDGKTIIGPDGRPDGPGSRKSDEARRKKVWKRN